MRRQFDFPVTVAIVLIAAVFTILSIEGEPVSAFLRADRDALVGGQVWRLLSGPFVHATWGHFLRDLVVVVVIGVAYEKPLRPVMPSLLVISLAVPAAVVLVADPSLAGYVGLSGLSHAWIAAALTYELLMRRRDKRWFVGLVALGFAIKLIYEQTGAPSVIPTSLGDGAVPAPLAHAAGALAASVLVLLNRARFVDFVRLRRAQLGQAKAPTENRT